MAFDATEEARRQDARRRALPVGPVSRAAQVQAASRRRQRAIRDMASKLTRMLMLVAVVIVGSIGWGRQEVVDAAAAVMGMGYVVPLWPTPSRLALRDELVEHWLPEGFHQVFFTSGGSESTDSAIRLARAYQVAKGRESRWKVIGRHPSYHGMTTGTMAVSRNKASPQPWGRARVLPR